MAEDDRDTRERAELAAEFALGTLSPEEKAAAERLLATDEAFATEVEDWSGRLDVLLDTVPPSEPPEGALMHILSEIENTSAENASSAIKLKRSVRVWQWAAAVAMGLAVYLAVIVLRREAAPAPQPQFVAVLETNDNNPALVATIDLQRRAISIWRIGPEPQPGRSYELWAIRDRSTPESLGLVDRSIGLPASRLLNAAGGASLSGLLLAVTIEPHGGSPTGKPSGAPIFVGKLVQAPSL